DLTQYLPGDTSVGSEVELVFAGRDPVRTVSRETGWIMLPSPDDMASRQFLALHTLTAVFKDAKIMSVPEAPPDAVYSYYPYTQECPAPYLLNNKWVDQCCFSQAAFGYGYYTIFVNSNGQLVRRAGPSTPCSGAWGEACYGDDCWY